MPIIIKVNGAERTIDVDGDTPRRGWVVANQQDLHLGVSHRSLAPGCLLRRSRRTQSRNPAAAAEAEGPALSKTRP